MLKTIKAKYRNGMLEPMEKLEIPDDIEITITIDTNLIILNEAKDGNWWKWQGILKGTSALQEHEQEHKNSQMSSCDWRSRIQAS